MLEALREAAQLVFIEWSGSGSYEELTRGLRVASQANPPVPVVILAPPGFATFLQRARAEGAADILLSPPDPREIGAEIEDACGPKGPLDLAEKEHFRKITQDLLIGQNSLFRRRLDESRLAARCDANVLIQGETGVGKEMFAVAIHRLGRRAGNPYMAVNCAGLPETLLESELFGHARGAFTGAFNARIGRFEAAGAGTLLLDEVGDIQPWLQTKLLRVIEQREFQRLGENTNTPFNARLICATSVDLDQAVEEGTFRKDLLGRIRQFRILLPPLRERRDDIPLLARHFLDKHARTRMVDISPSAMEILERFDFPMNVRQIENIVVEALARSDPGHIILPKHLPEYVAVAEEAKRSKDPVTVRVLRGVSYEAARAAATREIDRLYLPLLLEKNAGNQSRAADEAGIDRKTFSSRLEQIGKLRGEPHDA
jgi:DNA-binding NtrC family response regulator